MRGKIINSEEIVQAYLKQHNCSEISRFFGISRKRVCRILNANGIETDRHVKALKIAGKINLLTPIKEDGQDKNGHTMFLFRCDCGNIIKTQLYLVKIGGTKSCGCLKNRKGIENPCWKGCGNISGAYWKNIKKGAEKRKINFNLTIQEAWNRFLEQDGKCLFTGIDLVFESQYATKSINQTASLDRINSNFGYEINNICWVHKEINIMRMRLSVQDFIEFCKIVSNREKIINDTLNKILNKI